MTNAVFPSTDRDISARLFRGLFKEQGIGGAFGTGVDLPTYFYVDSGTGSDSNDGREASFPLATISAAIGKAVASRNDVIFVAPGHAETLTASLAISKIGLSVIGLGNKRLRPAITFNHTVDGFDITAANVRISGFYFITPSGAVTSYINVGAADAEIDNCEFVCGANATNGVITIPDAGDRAHIHDCTWKITANGPTMAISIESASTDGVTLERLTSRSGSVANAWDNAFIYSTVAHTGCLVENVRNDFGPTLIFSGAATGLLKDIWPGEISEAASGYQLVGGACSMIGGPEEGYRINKATADISTSAAVDLLTITSGRMVLKKLVAEVTTAIAAGTTPDLKFQANPTNTGNTTNDLCATLNIASDPIGTLYTLSGLAATALIRGETGGVTMGMTDAPLGMAINPGAIEAINDEDVTGSIKIAMWVKKLDPACIWAWT